MQIWQRWRNVGSALERWKGKSREEAMGVR